MYFIFKQRSQQLTVLRLTNVEMSSSGLFQAFHSVLFSMLIMKLGQSGLAGLTGQVLISLPSSAGAERPR